MDIRETTPPPQQRTFNLSVTETEMDEIRLAFNAMLERQPQWYTNTQQERVTVMRDMILEMQRAKRRG
jgi:delta 1-pyrroline-5-carboxylate dehydrogenase